MMIDENKQRWNKHKTDLINQIGNKWVFFFYARNRHTSYKFSSLCCKYLKDVNGC